MGFGKGIVFFVFVAIILFFIHGIIESAIVLTLAKISIVIAAIILIVWLFLKFFAKGD